MTITALIKRLEFVLSCLIGAACRTTAQQEEEFLFLTYTELLKSEGRVLSISLHLVVILRLILYSLSLCAGEEAVNTGVVKPKSIDLFGCLPSLKKGEDEPPKVCFQSSFSIKNFCVQLVGTGRLPLQNYGMCWQFVCDARPTCLSRTCYEINNPSLRQSLRLRNRSLASLIVKREFSVA